MPIATSRFKRSLFGYKPGDVDAAFSGCESALAECGAALTTCATAREEAQRQVMRLEGVCDQLSITVVDRERELTLARLELQRLRDEEADRLRLMSGLLGELEGVRRQARGQATRIRLRALRDAVELSARLTQLDQSSGEARERLQASLEEAIARLGSEDDEELVAEAPAPVLRPVDDVFDGLVEIEVGPFRDFSQLVGFEDAAGGISATSQISVKRFAKGRATLEMRLAEPVELLRELELRSPFEFEVRDQRADRLVLDVPTPDAEAA